MLKYFTNFFLGYVRLLWFLIANVNSVNLIEFRQTVTMPNRKKQDCKYWDKCYQKNDEHRDKYNHPVQETDHKSTSPESSDSEEPAVEIPESPPKPVSKRQETSPPDDDCGDEDVHTQVRKRMKLNETCGSSPRKPPSTNQSGGETGSSSESDASIFLSRRFLVEMPDDFYKFWEFCEKQIKAGRKPQTILEPFGLKLVGPFDYLAGNFNDGKHFEPAEYLRHWRFFYDPPEFQTVFAKQQSGIHFGYWRDDPKDKENLLMARNDANKGYEFEFVGGNCFETVLYYLDNDSGLTPFNRQAALTFKKSLQDFAASNKIDLSSLNALKKKRSRNVVCKTFHTVGLVVPFDRQTELGYRGLIESEAKLKKVLEKFERAKGDELLIASGMEDLQPFITAANIAVDECDFGTAIELGIDLFCAGHKELHNVVKGLLITGYSMVHRPQFIAILKSHLDGRKRGFDLSILN